LRINILSLASLRKEFHMPRGDKSSYTSKQKRKAEHIEESYEKRGTSAKEAARRAWATVNKESGGGKKGGAASARRSASARSASAKRAAATRKSRGH
jgi:plasmid stabilization system protein ParE